MLMDRPTWELAKLRTGRPKVRMVEQVEGVCLKLQTTALSHPELFVNAEVYIGKAGTGEDIPARRSIAPPPCVADDHAVAGAAGVKRTTSRRYSLGNQRIHANELRRIKEAVRRTPVGVNGIQVGADEPLPIVVNLI